MYNFSINCRYSVIGTAPALSLPDFQRRKNIFIIFILIKFNVFLYLIEYKQEGRTMPSQLQFSWSTPIVEINRRMKTWRQFATVSYGSRWWCWHRHWLRRDG